MRKYCRAMEFPLHTYLFLAYPFLYLYANNISELEIDYIVRPLSITIILVLLIQLALNVLHKNPGKNSLIITVGLILFFSYGHIYRMTGELEIFGEPIGRHRYLLPFTFAVFFVWSWWVVKQNKVDLFIHRSFNLVGIIVLLIPVTIIGRSFIGHGVVGVLDAPSQQIAIETTSDTLRPDVYYIVLDGYGGQDVLLDLYNLDNSPFLNSLKSMGFYVVKEGHSNYMQTLLSLASSLNMDYLNGFEGWETKTRNDLNVFRGLIRQSDVRKAFDSLGYEMVAFETGYGATNILDADIYLAAPDSIQAGGRFILSPNEFEDLLIDTSLALTLRSLQTKTGIFDTIFIEDPYTRHRQRVRFTLSTLGEIPSWEGDYFVFAHIINPHPPFIFDENGAVIRPEGTFSFYDASNYPGTKEEYIQRYRQQVIYLNTLIMETVEMILSQSEIDPIIILQADHGPGAYLQTNSLESSNLKERFSILNAYHFPMQGNDILDKNITPVNSFRLLFNRYFDASYELLDDEMYFATWRRPFKFINVTKELIQ